MRQSWFVVSILLLGFVMPAWTFSDQPQAPKLSSAERNVISEQIGKVKPAADREVAKGWSNAKKVAEFICRPAALRSLSKQDTSIDKVFLGTDDPATLALDSTTRLRGTGQYRKGDKWTDIEFVCDVDPDTGKVSSFQWTTIGSSGGQ